MRYLFLLLLTSCSLHHGTSTAVEKTIPIRIVNKEQCQENWAEVKSYLLSHGLLIHETDKAEKTFICLWEPGLLLRLLMLTPINGYADGRVAWAIDDEDAILHEIGHLFGLTHNWRGVMFPMSNMLGTGLTDGELEVLKR